MHSTAGHEGFASDRHTFAQAHVNVVLAALTVLTGSSTEGTVTCSAPFVPTAERERVALLEAAAAIQTEVSLSIFASDPLIKDASFELGAHIREIGSSEEMEAMVVTTDALLQEWIGLLQGRAGELESLAGLLLSKGALTLPEIADYLNVPA